MSKTHYSTRLSAYLLISAGIFLTIILCHSICRDLHLREDYPGDLRNRVVVARLQKDGKLPYHYHWAPGDGPRYWGAGNCNQPPESGNKITASPFFHELLFPICDFSFLTISWIWLLLQYIMLGGMIFIFCRFTNNRLKRILLIATGVLFTATEAWKSLISDGQLYFFVAFLMCLILAGLIRNRKSSILIAGICAAAFVLNRPIALVMFIPFIFQWKKYKLFLITAFSGLFIYGMFVLFVPSETALWKDYALAVKAHVAMHQAEENPGMEKPTPCPVADMEGFSPAGIDRSQTEHPIKVYVENGNVFVIYQLIFHRKMPLAVLNMLSLLTVFLLTVIYVYVFRKHPISLIQTLIFGFTLYMLVEIFNPIHRIQYNTTQWLPIVMAGILFIENRRSLPFLLLIAGLVLNISNTTWIPMRHTLGEICWLTGLLLIVYFRNPNHILWKQPS